MNTPIGIVIPNYIIYMGNLIPILFLIKKEDKETFSKYDRHPREKSNNTSNHRKRLFSAYDC